VLEFMAGRARPGDAGIRVLDGATAVGWYDGVVTAIDESTLWSIHAGSVIAATGTYERVPSVRGADRPRVMGARLVERLISGDRVLPGERPLLVGDAAALSGVRSALAGEGVRPVAEVPTSALRRILGRRGVTGAIVEAVGRARRLSADVVVFADRTPNLELILAAGAAVERRDDVIVPVLDDAGRTTVAGLSVVGSATGRDAPASSTPVGRTLVCFCEDVHADEIEAQVRAGYGDPELVKRRTGALTGPCQGKYCLQGFTCVLAAAGAPIDALPTGRPPLRPIRLGDLVTDDEGAGDP